MLVKNFKSENEINASGLKVFLNVLFSLNANLLLTSADFIISLYKKINTFEILVKLRRNNNTFARWRLLRHGLTTQQPLSTKPSSLPDLPFDNLALLCNRFIFTQSSSSCCTGCVQHRPIVGCLMYLLQYTE